MSWKNNMQTIIITFKRFKINKYLRKRCKIWTLIKGDLKFQFCPKNVYKRLLLSMLFHLHGPLFGPGTMLRLSPFLQFYQGSKIILIIISAMLHRQLDSKMYSPNAACIILSAYIKSKNLLFFLQHYQTLLNLLVVVKLI